MVGATVFLEVGVPPTLEVRDDTEVAGIRHESLVRELYFLTDLLPFATGLEVMMELPSVHHGATCDAPCSEQAAATAID